MIYNIQLPSVGFLFLVLTPGTRWSVFLGVEIDVRLKLYHRGDSPFDDRFKLQVPVGIYLRLLSALGSMGLGDVFEPESIAVVGASATQRKLGNDAMANVKEFDGQVYPVNPSEDGEIYGYEVVDSIEQTDADLALCCVPASVTPDVLADCGAAGVGAAVIFAGGFAEASDAGQELQQSVRETAERYDITIIGPNTAGHILPQENLYASFVPGFEAVEAGEVAVLAQSGGIGVTATFQLDREGYGVSGMFGLGNRVNTDFDDVIPKLDKDPSTKAIALNIEGTPKKEKLIQAVDAAETPITVFKSGNRADEFVRAHTASPVQRYEEYEDPLIEAGAILVHSMTKLLDASRVLAKSPVPDGSNVGMVTAQAGPGIMMADYLKEQDVTFPTLQSSTNDRLQDLLPGFTYDDNPVDTGRPMPEFGDVIDTVARDENIDIVLAYEIFEHSLGYPVGELRQLTDDVDKPIIFTVAGPDEALTQDRQRMEDAGVVTYDSPERGAFATSVLTDSVR